MSDASMPWEGMAPDAKRDLLARLLREKAHREAVEPLSHGQRALWMLHQLAPASAAYNVAFAARILSPLDVPAFSRALQGLKERHEMLRATYVTLRGEPVVRIPPGASAELEEEDARDWPEEALRQRLALSYARPFDLEQGPVLRASLFHRAQEDVLLITVHHIAYDGWSIGLLVNDLFSLYAAEREGRPPALSPLPARYADFVRWQNELLDSPRGEELWAFWRATLGGSLPVIQLPTDKPRPVAPTYRGGTHSFAIDADLAGRLRELARQQGATLYMVLLAAFTAVLHRHSGQEDILVGSPTAGRSRSEFEPLIGYFVNPVVLRTDLSSNPRFVDLVARVRTTVIDALKHADYPFPLLVQRLNPERDPSRSPVFQVEFNLFKLGQTGFTEGEGETGASRLNLGGVMLETLSLDQQEGQFDLSLELVDTGSALLAHLKYATDLVERETIERMAGHLASVLRGVVEKPETNLLQLTLLTEAERDRVVVEWNATARSYPDGARLHALIEEQVRRTPKATAVCQAGRELSYEELNRRANRLARVLRTKGVGPEKLVAVYAERSLELVVALLAVIKAGGAYVPVDPTYPAERVQQMLEDAQAPVVLVQQHLVGRIPAQAGEVLPLGPEGDEFEEESAADLTDQGTPDNLAYVIFTSGSTGRPKGAMNTHRGICNRLLWMQDEYGLRGTDRVLQKTPFSFDVSVWEFFWPLLAGATLEMALPEAHKDSAYLVRTIREKGITTLHFVPSMLRVFLEEPGIEGCSSLVRVVCSGEALPAELKERFFERLPGVELHNLYGPTEAAVDVTYWKCEPGPGRTVPIGRPVANTQMFVLDRYMEPVPIGVAGELYIGGVQVGRGYYGRPDLTADRFVPDPFSARPGARLYRTGDRARHLPDGAIEYLGRLDYQLKLRGFRIELGEIEAGLDRQPGVGQCVVVAREDVPGDPRLVAYVVPREGASLTASGLRGALQASLPEYMVPSAFVLLDALPLTPSGKVDRKALPVPQAAPVQAKGYEAPRTATEEILCGIWGDVLRQERVGIADDFFDLGGHSLLATQVVSRVRRAFDVNLPLTDIFATPTVAGLARAIDRLRTDGVDREPAPPLVAAPGAPPVASHAQERLWFLDRIEPGSKAYIISGALEIRGRLDESALEKALAAVVARHDALRTTFSIEAGRPVPVVAEAGSWSLPRVDLRDLAEGDESVSARVSREAELVFDLERGPLFRAVLHKLGDDRHVLLLSMHHIVSDGWSLGVLVRELGDLYDAFSGGPEGSLPALPLQYHDYARWQRTYLEGGEEERQLGYWRKRLAGAPASLDLPADRPRPPMESHRGATFSFLIPSSVVRPLEALGRREGTTLFMTVLAVFQVLLSRYSGQPDVVVGSPVANRNRAEIEGLIGFFVNTLLLRGDLGGNPKFRELLARVRESCLQALGHQDLPFERLVEEMRPERDLSRNPLFQVMFVLQNTPLRNMALRNLELVPFPLERSAAQVDLTLYAQETPEGLRGTFEYATDLFDATTIERMAGHLGRLLSSAAQRPDARLSDLDLLTEEEEGQLGRWNATERSYPKKCLHELILEQAALRPEQVAAEGQDGRLTYGELVERSGRLAGHLRELGVGPGVLVGIYMERSLDMLVALLAVLRAGGAYVPLDPAYPRERLEYMIGDSGAPVILTQQGLRESVPGGDRVVVAVDGDWAAPTVAARTAVTAQPEDIAYVIYTSGSTGKPKGVAVTHRSLVNLLESMAVEPGLGTRDVLLSVTTLSFDIAGLELYLPLLKGARLVLLTREEAGDGRVLRERLATTGASVLQATPATWRLLLESGWEGTPGLKALCGGEALPRDLANELARRAAEVWNVYGPTETTIWSSACLVKEGEGPVSIGRPLANTALYVLDGALKALPVGVPGELFIGGDGLARGYWKRPDLTAEKFLPDPHSPKKGARMYRTGDLARRLSDGTIECLGRLDHQVKVRGFRIELGEIEAALRGYAGVTEAVASVQEVSGADRRLLAYLTLQGDVQPNVTALREHLRGLLPSYMVPSSFFFLDDLPLTPNGKVDRKALARLGAGASAAGRAHVAPRTPSEALIADIWRDALKVDKVGVRDNFFDLGGHSLLAMRVLAVIEDRTGHRFHPRDIIFQTLEQLAAACATAPDPGPVAEPAGRLQRLLGALRGRVAPGGSDSGA